MNSIDFLKRNCMKHIFSIVILIFNTVLISSSDQSIDLYQENSFRGITDIGNEAYIETNEQIMFRQDQKCISNEDKLLLRPRITLALIHRPQNDHSPKVSHYPYNHHNKTINEENDSDDITINRRPQTLNLNFTGGTLAASLSFPP